MKILSLFSGFLALPVIVGTLPNNILNGQVEDAVPVMGNFNYIVNQINANGAARGINADITQLNGLVVPLSVGQGGTGGQTATATFNTGSVTLASAATVNIGAATSPNINISGAATITAFDIYAEGALRFITYTGTATITYNAVTMQLVGAASRTNQVGGFSVFRSLGAGNWREESYQAPDGSILGNAPTSTNSVTATVSNRVDSGLVTVASAATPDIFGAAGNSINYTGTATATGFVAAAKAGMTRTLICAGACQFTAGANLLIEGIKSGNTITLGANAIVNVVALTTTQFKMTYSVSGTFIAVLNGFTAVLSSNGTFNVTNGIVTINTGASQFGMYGTSNNIAMNLTGMPAPCYPFIPQDLAMCRGLDNGSAVLVMPQVVSGNGEIDFLNGLALGNFTASGSKGLQQSTFIYPLN